MAQWLRLCASTAGGTGSIPDLGTKIPRAAQYDLNKLNKDTQKNEKKIK